MTNRISFKSEFPPDLDDKEIERIKHSSWGIDCSRMIVKSCKLKNRATYYGPGRISQSIDGHLEFKLYSNQEKNPIEWPFETATKSGELIPNDEFFELTATDTLNRKWHAVRFIPSFHITASGRTIIDGNLFEISSSGKFPETSNLKGYSLNLWVYEKVNIPCNSLTRIRKSVAEGRYKTTLSRLNSWKFRCISTDFLLIKEEDGCLTIHASNRIMDLPVDFATKVLQALQFLLGWPLYWSVMKKRIGLSSTIVIRSKHNKSLKGRFQPPLPTSLIQNPGTKKLTASFHKSLFERFLKYTLYNEEPGNPIWSKVDAIFEASSRSFIDAEALTLTVAIESILASEYSENGSPSDTEKAAIAELLKYIGNWDGNEYIKKRALGSVGNFYDVRAGDRMRDLVKKGAINEEQFRSWEELRNQSTHSYQKTNKPIKQNFQLIYKCEVLFYFLIFYTIGYRGPYTDLSTPGWPLKKYPDGKI